MNKKAATNQGRWILIAVVSLIILGMFVQNKYEIFSVIPATGTGAANQQCTFIADLNPNYFSTWECNLLGGASWISYDVNNDGVKEKFGKWYSHSQNQGDSCDSIYYNAATLDIPGIDNVEIRYGHYKSETTPNRLVVCCGLKSWGFEEGKGQYDNAVTTCPVYNPPTCTPNWVLGTWSECFNSLQTRNVVDSNNCGVTVGKPATSQSCTVLPTCTSSSYQFSLMPNTCPSTGQQTKIYTKVTNCEGGIAIPSNEIINCNYVAPTPTCTEADWTSTLSSCLSNNLQTRTWTKIGTCSGGVTHSTDSVSCVYSLSACAYTYSAWGACQSSGVQIRTVTNTPTNCNGAPTLSQSCSIEEPVVCEATQMNVLGTCFDKTMFWIVLAIMGGIIIFMVVKR